MVSVSMGVEPNKLTQFNQLNAATFQAIPMPGVTMGDAVQFLTRKRATCRPASAMTGNRMRASSARKARR